MVEIDGGSIRRIVYAANCQLQVHREDSSLKRNPVADVPAEPFSELDSGKGARPITNKGFELKWVDLVLRVHASELGRLAPELREEVALVDVDAAEPLHPDYQRDSRHLLDLLLIGNGHGCAEGDRVSDHQPQGGIKGSRRPLEF